MNAEVRRKVGMGESASDFCHAHPSDNALFQEALAGLDSAVAETKEKHGQWLANVGAQATSTASRDHFRDWIRMQFRLITRTAQAIAKKEAGFALQFRMPTRRDPDLKMVAEFRAMCDAGETHLPKFTRYGVLPTFFADMRQELTRFEEILQERTSGRVGHIGSHAVLDDVLARIMHHVDDLDAVNALRFQGNAELAAAWRAASRMPSRKRQKPAAAKSATS